MEKVTVRRKKLYWLKKKKTRILEEGIRHCTDRGKNEEENHKRGRKKKEKKSCTDRESNPGLPRGRREFYHWTISAMRKCSPAQSIIWWIIWCTCTQRLCARNRWHFCAHAPSADAFIWRNSGRSTNCHGLWTVHWYQWMVSLSATQNFTLPILLCTAATILNI